jgi:hypothetical protein
MADGYVGSYKELLETTAWEQYGRGRDPRCANCMAHCGYEPTAVMATMGSPRESLRATADVLRGAAGVTGRVLRAPLPVVQR